MELSRREILQVGGLSAAAVAGVALPFAGSVTATSASKLDRRLMPKPYATAFAVPPVLRPVATGVNDEGPWSSYVVNEMAGTARLVDRVGPIPVWGYGGRLPGPTIHSETGHQVLMRIRNRLPETHPLFGHVFNTSTHLHGNANLPEHDGYASDLVRPGFSKTYVWPGRYQPGRTLWYHDHASHTTAQNVYSGLVGQYHVHDAVERALLPQRPFDVPLTLSDVLFAANGTLGFDDRDRSGVWGDVILVNGRPWPVMKVQRRVYRFRILNASTARSYRLALLPQAPFHVVATDGGLIPTRQDVADFRLGTGERYEVLIDFTRFPRGRRVELRNLSNQNNRDFDHTDKVMAFDVTGDPVNTSDPTWRTLPTQLAGSAAMNLRREQSMRKRHMKLKKSDKTNLWSINERTWEDVVASGFTEVFGDPGLDDVEIWTIENSSGGWHHPVHIHLVDFQILSRNGRAPFPHELGPKDTVYVGEEETVEVIMRFGPHRGKYMIHCHNLSHEDHDMMIQYSVGLQAGEVDEHDPINAAPAQWDTDGDDFPTSVIEME